MKKLASILFIFVLVSILISSIAMAEKFVGSYVCFAKGNKLRQHSQIFPADAKLFFLLFKNDKGNFEIQNVVGHISVSYVDEALLDDTYYGIFKYDVLKENPKYDPDVYKEHIQFRDFDATKTNRVDGGGMWGTLIINKNTSKDAFDAHYIFHAGDHMGGTVDFICKQDKRIFY